MENKISVLRIYGDIVENTDAFAEAFGVIEDVISPKQVSDFIDENKDSEKIIVKINSRGGSVDAGFAIHDLLINSGKTIETIGEGKIYSIATVVLLAGSVRKMTENASFLIHNPYIPEYTLADSYEADDLLKLSESLRAENEKILDFYISKTNGDKDYIKSMMDVETKMSSEKAKELGFITEILKPIKAFALLNNNQNKYKMDKNIEEIKTEMSGFKKAIDKIMNFINPVEVKNLNVTTEDGISLTIVTESNSYAVVDAVMNGDVVAENGSYVLSDGNTITVLDGVISEIVEAVIETEEMKNLREENENIKAELEGIKTQMAEKIIIENKVKEDLTSLEANYNSMVERLSKIESNGKPPKAENFQAPKKETGTKLSFEEIIERKNAKKKQL